MNTSRSREEALLREYIRQSLQDQDLLNEGVKDVVIKAVKTALSKIDSLIEKLKRFTPASEKIFDVIEEKGAGDFFSKVEKMGQEFESSIDAAAGAVPSKIGESKYRQRTRYVRNRRASLNEHIQRNRALNEVVLGGFEIVGLILAAIGGVPLLLKGLYKLAGLLRLKTVSEKLKVAYEKAHHFEEAIIDYAIPDKVLYAVYIAIQEEKNPDSVANLKIYQSSEGDSGEKLGSDEPRAMTLKEFSGSKERKKYEKRAWAMMLLPWLISGLFSLSHMFHGIVGALEGAATGVKAIEVGTVAAESGSAIASEIGAAVSAMVKAA